MLVLGIESSCDETGVALYCTERGLIGNQLHTKMAMHAEYGGVVPELASRDHIRRLVPLTEACLREAGRQYADIDAVAFTQGPGLGGALLAGSAFANALAFSLSKPVNADRLLLRAGGAAGGDATGGVDRASALSWRMGKPCQLQLSLLGIHWNGYFPRPH